MNDRAATVAKLQVAGFRIVRVTHTDLTRDEASLAADLTRLLGVVV